MQDDDTSTELPSTLSHNQAKLRNANGKSNSTSAMPPNTMSSNKTIKSTTSERSLSPDLQRIIDLSHHDPFSYLGQHQQNNITTVRAALPTAKTVWIQSTEYKLKRIANSHIFEWAGKLANLPDHYSIEWVDNNETHHCEVEPYTFSPQLLDFDLHLFQQGKHHHIYRLLGAHLHSIDGFKGVLFAVWAPSASRISVVGDFNSWDGRRHPMRNRGASGVWELFIPNLAEGHFYKFEVRSESGQIQLKSDPYGQAFEMRPHTASKIMADCQFPWQDQAWLSQRRNADWLHKPMSIYEVHLGSWRRDANNKFLNYRSLAEQLVDYVISLEFTHIQLLPITEHPLDASWGYQTTGYFAPTSRFGEPDDFRFFIDLCHRNNIGVFLDWVPAHFPKDAHGLARFDGSALYEHDDPRRGEHRDWGTYIYNYGRNEVKNFLLSNAVYWIEEFHIDGLRVDAVASMLYLDYSREEGDWIPNIHGSNENIEAIEFIRELNTVIHGEFPGTLVIAEESTSWPQVTRPTWLGGLGFSMKWNMGWMHDTLEYINKDPIHRHFHHNQLTFGLLYAFTENFVLPFSHDEVVHGKGSMILKMPGDEWQRFANLRVLYTYMYTYPGKKISFMGNEIAQGPEWDFDSQLEWYVLDYPIHQGIQKCVKDLNHLYCQTPALHYHDFDQCGFEWIDCNDSVQSVLSFIRHYKDSFTITVLNLTPVPRYDYKIGVPKSGDYAEIFNSDSTHYNGSDVGNQGKIVSKPIPYMGKENCLSLTLPPLGGIIIQKMVTN